MFSHITQNWRGRPLVSHETIVNLIANTTTRKGLKISAKLDTGESPLEVTVSDAEMAAIRLTRDDFHGDWNYSLNPRPWTYYRPTNFRTAPQVLRPRRLGLAAAIGS